MTMILSLTGKIVRKSLIFLVVIQNGAWTEALTIRTSMELASWVHSISLNGCWLLIIKNSMLTDHKPVYSGCCGWIFSTINGREFCKTGKVVEPHFTLGKFIYIF